MEIKLVQSFSDDGREFNGIKVFINEIMIQGVVNVSYREGTRFDAGRLTLEFNIYEVLQEDGIVSLSVYPRGFTQIN